MFVAYCWCSPINVCLFFNKCVFAVYKCVIYKKNKKQNNNSYTVKISQDTSESVLYWCFEFEHKILTWCIHLIITTMVYLLFGMKEKHAIKWFFFNLFNYYYLNHLLRANGAVLFCCFSSTSREEPSVPVRLFPPVSHACAPQSLSERTRRMTGKYFHLASGGVAPSCDSLRACNCRSESSKGTSKRWLSGNCEIIEIHWAPLSADGTLGTFSRYSHERRPKVCQRCILPHVKVIRWPQLNR